MLITMWPFDMSILRIPYRCSTPLGSVRLTSLPRRASQEPWRRQLSAIADAQMVAAIAVAVDPYSSAAFSDRSTEATQTKFAVAGVPSLVAGHAPSRAKPRFRSAFRRRPNMRTIVVITAKLRPGQRRQRAVCGLQPLLKSKRKPEKVELVVCSKLLLRSQSNVVVECVDTFYGRQRTRSVIGGKFHDYKNQMLNGEHGLLRRRCGCQPRPPQPLALYP